VDQHYVKYCKASGIDSNACGDQTLAITYISLWIKLDCSLAPFLAYYVYFPNNAADKYEYIYIANFTLKVAPRVFLSVDLLKDVCFFGDPPPPPSDPQRVIQINLYVLTIMHSDDQATYTVLNVPTMISR
jgi:hypothetical protein